MLEFAKVYNHDEDNSMTSAEIKTFFAVTQDGMTIIASRVIFMKAKRLVFTIDGTVGALARKVNDTTKMPNDDFAMFSDIQFASLVEVNDAI